MTESFDAIVIGTGQAGPSLAARLVGAGLKTAIVERKRFGGTCVNNGCIPTKTLVASAKAADMARRAADYGVRLDGPVRVDMKAVKARKDAIVHRSNSGVERWLKGMDGLGVIEGHAAFTGPREIAVGDRRLSAKRIFINVGARAAAPPLPGLERVPYLDNVSMLELDELPRHLIVLGGSYIALEFAQIYRRFGAAVTVVNRGPRLLSREDEDIAAAVREFLEEEGVRIVTGTAGLSVEGGAGEIALSGTAAGTPFALEGSHLLVATGRVPNTHDLGLDAAGVATDKRGFITVDDRLATSVEGVWALGDCNGLAAFTHTSYNEYEIVAANLLDGDDRRVSQRVPAYAVFVDPPLGRVGMTEREARASGRRVLVGRLPMTRVGRAVERGETKGFMKILVDADSERILGAGLLGVGCDEVVHCVLEVMNADAPYGVISRAMHIHPTVAEFLPVLLETLEPLEA